MSGTTHLERTSFSSTTTSNMNNETRIGILLFGSLGLLSATTTFLIIALLIRLMVSWKHNFNNLVQKNQCMVLVLNLFLADFLLGLGAGLGFRWVNVGGINGSDGFCWTQASLLHIGDLGSGFFVLALAMQGLYTFVREQTIPHFWLVTGVVSIWLLALLLTIVGPAKYGAGFFAKAGHWCWIAEEYNWERLWLHYLWVYIVQFGTATIYTGIFINLYRRKQKLCQTKAAPDIGPRLTRTMRLLALYPVCYVLLTFPIALSRMLGLSGYEPSASQMTTVGALVASCGWIDALVYTCTRRVLLHDSCTPGVNAGALDLESQVQFAALEGEDTRPGTSTSLAAKHRRPNFASANKPRPESMDAKDLKIEATVEWKVFEERTQDSADSPGVSRKKSAFGMRQKWYPS